MSELNAKVASILNDRRLAINAGSEHGVSVGDAVNFWDVISVRDPDTKETLGKVRQPRMTMVVEEVQERFAVAGVPTTKPTIFSGFLPQPAFRVSATGASSSSEPRVFHVKVGESVTVTLRSGEQN